MDLSIGTVTQDTATDSTESEDVTQAEHTGASVAAVTLDPASQYLQVDSSGEEVTYRMIHVGDSGQAQVIVPVSIGAQVLPQLLPIEETAPVALQTVSTQADNGAIQVFSQGSASHVFQTPAGMVVTAAAPSLSQETSVALGQVGTGSTGPFYVMVSPHDAIPETSGHQILSGGGKMMDNRSSRDDRRRASHNEVERRRRDKMNYWIIQLSKMVPDCAEEAAAAAATKASLSKSKGGILEKTCDYIEELQNANKSMADAMRDAQIIATDNELLKAQVEEVIQLNAAMKNTLGEHGVTLTCSDSLEGGEPS